jgi:hypothetical protein
MRAVEPPSGTPLGGCGPLRGKLAEIYGKMD